MSLYAYIRSISVAYKMVEKQDDKQCFAGKCFKDSSWSWIVCISAAICYSVNLGMALSFGVLFPALMEYFEETRERTGRIG